MIDISSTADWLIRSTCCVSLASLLALWGLRGVKSPFVHRLTCLAILLQGWIWFRWDVPVLPAEKSADVLAADTTPLAINNKIDASLIDRAIRDADRPVALTASTPAVETTSADPMSGTIDWGATIFGIWIVGIGVTVIIALARYIAFQRGIPQQDELPDEYHEEWRDVHRQTDVARTIPLWGLPDLGPACGWLRSRLVVFVPTERWMSFVPQQRWAILLHEAGHLRRGDLWKSVAIRLLALPQWFNPLAWRIVRRFDEAAEWACDEFVLRHQESCGPEFAEALLSLTVTKNSRPQFSAAANGHPLAERMRRLLSPSKPERTMTKSSMLITALALCTVANFVRLSAQEGVPTSKPDVLPQPPTEADASPLVPSVLVTDDAAYVPSDEAAPAGAVSGDILFSEASIDFTTDELKELPTTTIDFSNAIPADAKEVDPFDSPLPSTTASEKELPIMDEFSAIQTLPPVGSAPATTSPMLETTAAAQNEAVIDISEVFRRSIYFASETERLKAELAQVKLQMEEMQTRLQALGHLLNESEGDRHDELQRQMIELQVEIEVLTSKSQQSLQQSEAGIYLNTYRRVRTVIAEYARENGIHTVRRVRSGVNEGEIDAEQVLEWINSDIVYSADEPRDITQDVVDRLNAAEGMAIRQSAASSSVPLPKPTAVGEPVLPNPIAPEEGAAPTATYIYGSVQSEPSTQPSAAAVPTVEQPALVPASSGAPSAGETPSLPQY